MDKYEYKLRADEIKDLIAHKEYAEAMAIADTIDWRRVKNIMMLTTVSDLYKINRKYDVSRDLLLLAYDRHPGGRTIVYSLCELSIKLGEFVQAVEYYKEFVRVAPNDSGRFILKYKIYDAQEVSLEERIHVLEEFKEADYREKWGYELAFLYHRAGLERQCVAECDELILTFGDGKYVIKAMELKMLHQPLTPVQQEKYDNRNNKKKTQMSQEGKPGSGTRTDGQAGMKREDAPGQRRETSPQPQAAGSAAKAASDRDLDIHVRTLDMANKYNTLNIQAALADSMKEIMAKDALEAEARRKRAERERLAAEEAGNTAVSAAERDSGARPASVQQRPAAEQDLTAETERKVTEASSDMRAAEKSEEKQERRLPFDPNMDAASLVQDIADRAAMSAGSRYDNILAMENDGQISLVVPEESRVEKQITGQLSIEEVLQEWERMKRANDRKSMDDLKQRVLQQTGEMFTAFDKSTKSGILEGLEDENSTLANLPVQPKEPAPKPKTEAELLEESILDDDGLEGEDLPEVEELAEIEDDFDTGELGPAAGVAAEIPGGAAQEGMPSGGPAAGEAGQETPAGKESEEAAKQQPANAADVEYVVDTAMMGTVIEALEAQGLGGAGEPAGAENAGEPEADEASGGESAAENADAGDLEEEGRGETAGEDMSLAGDTKRLEAAIIEAELEEQNAAKKARSERGARQQQAQSDGFDTTEMMSVSDKLIENAEREVKGESEKPDVPSRALTEDEKELFGALIQTDQMKDQIAAAIDKVSLAAYTGNVIITGENGSGTMTLAKNLIKSVQLSDRNFSGRVARITGAALDKKDIPATLAKLRNGALIVEKANGMSAQALKRLTQYLEQENDGIIVILEDTKIEMRKCMNKNPALSENFNARIDINAMDNDSLVAYARDYAYDQEYSIDDLGILALYTRISDLQTGDHSVTLAEVRDIVDEAIWSANRKVPKHFIDILSGKRYDDEDMIVLREKDFIC